MKAVNRASLAIRRFLSTHISIHHLKQVSFAISIVTCLAMGSILLFSLISKSLKQQLDVSYLQINFISSLSALGMYLCLPVLGYLSDIYGPSLLAFLSVFFMVPSYFLNSLILKLDYSSQFNLVALCVTYGMIGLGTSSLYFSCLLTCSKIYPHYKGLSISLPVTCYGLSSLLGSQMLKMPYFKDHNGLDLIKVFNFFGFLYLVMGTINFVSSSIVTIEADKLFFTDDVEQSPGEPDETSELIPVSSIEPPNHKARFKAFLNDSSAWLFLFTFFLNIGPLESYQNNLNSILKKIDLESELENQVGVIAFFSTISRLFVGFLADYMESYKYSKNWLLVIVLVIGIVSQCLSLSFRYPQAISSLNGFAYGGIFTIYPTIIAHNWGIDILGSTWGSFMVAPALSSTAYSLIYGYSIDNLETLKYYFSLVTVSFVISLVVFINIWRQWARD